MKPSEQRLTFAVIFVNPKSIRKRNRYFVKSFQCRTGANRNALSPDTDDDARSQLQLRYERQYCNSSPLRVYVIRVAYVLYFIRETARGHALGNSLGNQYT